MKIRERRIQPSERGLNENTNGLIRQYIAKGHDFTSITKKDLKLIENHLNNRPRKSLNYATPNEIFNKRLIRLKKVL